MLYLVVRAICKYVFRIVIGMFGGIRVEGLGYVPRQGALLVAPNHQSDGDPIVVGVALPRPAYFMAKSELFEIRVLGPAIRFLHAFPVRRGKPDRQDRKSTRLNSSHITISYAVFCLKKKNKSLSSILLSP